MHQDKMDITTYRLMKTNAIASWDIGDRRYLRWGQKVGTLGIEGIFCTLGKEGRYLRWGQKVGTLGIEGIYCTLGKEGRDFGNSRYLRWGQKEETLGIEGIYVGDRRKGRWG